MPELTRNRLTILGQPPAVGAFAASPWLKALHGRHPEVYYLGKNRHEWWFESESQPPLPELENLSRQWPDLVFLLEFDSEKNRVKGLAKVETGRVELARFVY